MLLTKVLVLMTYVSDASVTTVGVADHVIQYIILFLALEIPTPPPLGVANKHTLLLHRGRTGAYAGGARCGGTAGTAGTLRTGHLPRHQS